MLTRPPSAGQTILIWDDVNGKRKKEKVTAICANITGSNELIVVASALNVLRIMNGAAGLSYST
jgi:hypothetical protein